MLRLNGELAKLQNHLGDLLFHQAQETAEERADFFPYLVGQLEPLTQEDLAEDQLRFAANTRRALQQVQDGPHWYRAHIVDRIIDTYLGAWEEALGQLRTLHTQAQSGRLRKQGLPAPTALLSAASHTNNGDAQ